jgi:hypothetical protein
MPRGRTRTVTDPTPPLVPGMRPAAPSELSEPEQAIWRKITARLPADYFTAENDALLVQLCRHIRHCDELAKEIAAVRAEMEAVRVGSDTAATRAKAEATLRASWLTLLRAHVLQSRNVGTLSTKLRLTQFSRYMRDAESAAIAARNSPTAPEPWTDWGNDDDGGRKQ